MVVEGKDANAEDGGGDRPERRAVGIEPRGEADSEGTGYCRDRVELGVGAEQRRGLSRDDVAEHAASHGGRDPQGGGRYWR